MTIVYFGKHNVIKGFLCIFKGKTRSHLNHIVIQLLLEEFHSDRSEEINDIIQVKK